MQVLSLEQFHIGKLPDGKTDVYTVAPGKTAIIREAVFFNADASEDVEVKLYINDLQMVKQIVAAGETLYCGHEWHLVLKENDKISVATSKTNVINAVLSGALATEG